MKEYPSLKTLGKKIKEIREASGLTYREMAELTDVSPSTLQKIENNGINPSVAVMIKVARGLKKRIGFFFDSEVDDQEVVFIKKREKSFLVFDDGRVIAENISMEAIQLKLRAYLLKISPGGKSGEDITHKGDEVFYCIKGKIQFLIGEDEYILRRGDCLAFNSEKPHCWKNIGRGEGQAFLICSVPPHWENLAFNNPDKERHRRVLQ